MGYCDVFLTKTGNNDEKIIQTLIEAFGFTGEDARERVSNVPICLMMDANDDEAANYKTTLEALGATIEFY